MTERNLDNAIGSQTPTVSVYLASDEDLARSKGKEAVDLYNKTGYTALPWQVKILEQLLATDESGLWVHSRFGYSVPRRNGKNEIVAMRELWGLVNGERILHTAHRTATSQVGWERLVRLLEKLGYKEKEDFKLGSRTGAERITMLKTDGRIDFRTRTSKGGLGEEASLLVIDEAQEYLDDQESSLKYIVSSTPNPQTLFCGTPPTMVSSGTVFKQMREDVIAGKRKHTGWAEWSVSERTDPNDREAWKMCNPSMGYIISERSIEDELGDDDLDFNIQRLGLWITYNIQSAIPDNVWKASMLEHLDPDSLVGKVHVGIKFGIDGQNTALAIACKLDDERVFIQSLYCKPSVNGQAWIIELLKRLDYAEVVADGKSGTMMLQDGMKEAKLKYLKLPTVQEFITANSKFEQAVFQKSIAHTEQQSLDQAVANCKKRNIGSGGGFGYASVVQELDIALLDSVILAYWSCASSKPKKKQKIGY